MNYDITPNHQVYVSYAISHREPTRTNYKDYASNGISYPKAERLNDLELGYTFRSPKFSAGINLYWMDYDNQFVLTGELDPIGNAITRDAHPLVPLGCQCYLLAQPCEEHAGDA